jgi:hypothetical protein
MPMKTLASLLKTKRFWTWEICGALIYSIPVVIRLATGNVVLPVLSLLETPWIGHYVPGNLVEKILVNAFFPGGAGAVAGEIFYANRNPQSTRRRKYFARLGGALLQTSAWTLFQFWGNMQNITGSYGSNLFEYPMVYPLNFALAALSIFTPDVLGFLRTKLANAYRKLRRSR